MAYADNATLPFGPESTFGGQPVDTSAVLIGYTRTGDANLDGVVNDDDVTIVGTDFAPGKPRWALGDFDYNGFVDNDDVTLFGVYYNACAGRFPCRPLIRQPLVSRLCRSRPRWFSWLLDLLWSLAGDRS